jgi:predicted AAA+ superfamily ATPase
MKSASQTFIARPQYLADLAAWRDKTDMIKIITGIRRSGKSTLFHLFQTDLMMHHGVQPRQIWNINFEDANFSDLLDWKKLHDHIQSNLVPDKMNYVFLDEIQNVPEFERAVNSLRLKGNVDIYITGSNSKILSGEFATLLSGRYITIHMQPLSFEEYVSAYFIEGVGSWLRTTREDVLNPRNRDIYAMFQDYLHNSSFPYTVQLLKFEPTAVQGGTTPAESKQVRQFLESLFDTIVLKDIVERKKVRDVLQLKKVIRFIFDNIGRETSVRGIKNALESDAGMKIDITTIENYLDGLMDAYVVYRAPRYDIKGKQHLKTNAKYYVADIGLRYLLLGREGDSGHILENVVYLELLRRGYDISIGKVGNTEVDFVAVKNGKTEYYQVAQEVSDKDTRMRELRSLDDIDDHNPKFLITMDRPFAEEHKGIRIINALNWLLSAE